MPLAFRVLLCAVLVLSGGVQAEIVQVTEHDDVVYMLESETKSLYRYDLATQSRLDDVSLSGTPSAIEVDDDYIYIGLTRELIRLDRVTFVPTSLRLFDYRIHGLFKNGNNLIVHSGFEREDLYSVTINNGDLIDRAGGVDPDLGEEADIPAFQEFVFNSSAGMLFSKSNDELRYRVPVSISGVFGDIVTIENEDFNNDTTRLFLSPDESRLFDAGGLAYDSETFDRDPEREDIGADKEWVDFFVPATYPKWQEADLLAFVDNGQLIGTRVNDNTCGLSGNTVLSVFDPPDGRDFEQVRRMGLEQAPIHLAAFETTIFIFQGSGTEVTVQTVQIDAVPEPVIDRAIANPSTIDFEPEEVFVSADGETLYMLHEELCTNTVFRYSLKDGRYLESVSLLFAPEYFDYLPSENTLYLGYNVVDAAGDPVNLVKAVDFDTVDQIDGQAEVSLARYVDHLQGMLALDGLLLVSTLGDYPDAFPLHAILDPQAMSTDLISTETETLCCDYSTIHWDSSTSTYIYAFEDSLVSRRLNTATASFTDDVTETALVAAIENEDKLLASNGSLDHLLLNTGRIFNLSTLNQVDAISNDVISGFWIDDQLFTMRELTTNTAEIQRWVPEGGTDNHYELLQSEQVLLEGKPLHLVKIPSNDFEMVLLAKKANGGLEIKSFSEDLIEVGTSSVSDRANNTVNNAISDGGAWYLKGMLLMMILGIIRMLMFRKAEAKYP